LRSLVALVLRIFFRRIAITGREQVPESGPVMLLLNHPNSLVDPLLLLGLAPRRVVFLAKEPLFRMPIIGALVRAAGSIPVFRRQDGAEPGQNRDAFARVWETLARGGAIALFPEGASHSDPRMRPFKTGSARMALGAASMNPGVPMRIVPGGLYYTAKSRFRSSALLAFGAPIVVPSEPLDANGEPAAASVRALTTELQTALAAVTLQADEAAALALVTRAERILSSTDAAVTGDRDLAQQFALRQRLLNGYATLRVRMPAEIAEVEALLTRYDAELAAAGLAPENLLASRLTVGRVVATSAAAVAALVVLAPLAIVGIAVNVVPYQLVSPLATRASHVEDDVVATAKIFAAVALFPLTWTVIAAVVGHYTGLPLAIVAWLLMPVAGYCALLFLERLDRLIGAARGLSLRLFRPYAFRRLDEQRQRIREMVLRLEEEIGDRR
jgi:glycerol-3-phosphate O-acyltransferase/dihydroxyacetone phosphate acyltransferase